MEILEIYIVQETREIRVTARNLVDAVRLGQASLDRKPLPQGVEGNTISESTIQISAKKER